MEANAPEKIYLNQDDGLIWHCRSYKDDIEYTRTDAFIKKACEFIEERLVFKDDTWHTDKENNYKSIKEKVIEDFLTT